MKHNTRTNTDFSTLKPRQFDGAKKKAVWANYLNMARQNLFQTLCHISHVLGLEYDNHDGRLEEQLIEIPAVSILGKTKKVNAEVQMKAMKMFTKHFPFMSPMLEKYVEIRCNEEARTQMAAGVKERNVKVHKEITEGTYFELMDKILPVINLLRNKYTHYHLKDERLDDSERITGKAMSKRCATLAVLVNYCFDSSRRVIKERFGTGEGARLSEHDLDFLTAEGGLRYYKEIVEDNSGNGGGNNGKKAIKFTERADYKYRVFDNVQKISDIGLFMLICMFLNKKSASEFADKVDFFGDSLPQRQRPSAKEKFIVREMLSVYRIRLPKERLESTRSDAALGLDMLNELKKCPAELFDTLSPADQNKFRVTVEDDEDGDVLLMRSHDRFPTLALNYIDSKKLFKDIRFQVQLGNYRYKFYEKKDWLDRQEDGSLVSGAERIRILQKELTGYGRLEEIEAERKTRWADKVRLIDQPRHDTLETEPYVTDHHASYLFNSNRIGLQWNTAESHPLTNGIFMPSLDLPEWVADYPENSQDIRGSEEKAAEKVARCIAPTCWLSVYEIPAVIFLSLLTGSGEKAESIIMETTERYRKLFRDIRSGTLLPGGDLSAYGLDKSDIPEKIQDYLDGRKINMTKRFLKLAKDKLEKMEMSAKFRLEHFREDRKMYATKENKRGKGSHVDLRPGTLAKYLADDIMFFTPANSANVTGQNFNVLQAELAMYPRHEDALPERMTALKYLRKVMTKGGLLTPMTGHPFLSEVMNSQPSSFYDLYEKYLSAKVKYLEYCVRRDNDDIMKLPFLYAGRKKWATRDASFYRELAGRYEAIELPKGLFLPAIKEALAGKIGTDGKVNVTFLIAEYMKNLGDGPQAFYGNAFKRYYKYMSMTINPEWDYSNPFVPLVKKYYSVSEMENFLKQKSNDSRKAKWDQAVKDRAERRISRIRQDAWNYETRRRNILKERDEELAISNDKVRRYRYEYADNEKLIRRYKVQDMLMFLMAQDILTAAMKRDEVKTDFSAYKLKDIGTDRKDILSALLPFAITLKIPSADGSFREISIRQDDLKLKNYGDFFRFIYDYRTLPLLQNCKKEEISRAEIEKEFDNYDSQRVGMFERCQAVEKAVFDKLTPEQLSPKDEEGKPVKVDFKYLLSFVDIKESNKALIRTIRNAFCHSTYPIGEQVSVVIRDSDIPEVAKTLVVTFGNKTSQIKLKEN